MGPQLISPRGQGGSSCRQVGVAASHTVTLGSLTAGQSRGREACPLGGNSTRSNGKGSSCDASMTWPQMSHVTAPHSTSL